MNIPDSINAIIADETLHDGVVQLVAKLNGKKMVADNWAQSRDYAKALSMAAMARSDYVLLMHDLWDATWGEAGALDLGEPDDSEPNDPHTIWEHWEIYRYVGLSRPIGACAHVIFYVEFDPHNTISLSVSFEDEDYNQIPIPNGLLEEGTGWHSVKVPNDDFIYPILYSASIPSKTISTAAEPLRESVSDLIVRLKAL